MKKKIFLSAVLAVILAVCLASCAPKPVSNIDIGFVAPESEITSISLSWSHGGKVIEEVVLDSLHEKFEEVKGYMKSFFKGFNATEIKEKFSFTITFGPSPTPLDMKITFENGEVMQFYCGVAVSDAGPAISWEGVQYRTDNINLDYVLVVFYRLSEPGYPDELIFQQRFR